jgi:hypothetical protein
MRRYHYWQYKFEKKKLCDAIWFYLLNSTYKTHSSHSLNPKKVIFRGKKFNLRLCKISKN